MSIHGGSLFGYYINLDERGDFYADVRAPDGESVFEIRAEEDGSLAPIEDGFMRHKEDLDGLRSWLVDLGILGADSELLPMSEFERRIETDSPEP